MAKNPENKVNPLIIRNGLIFMVVLSLVLIITNPTNDRYISTLAQTPKAEINTNETFVILINQTCQTNLILSSAGIEKCRELVIEKRQYIREFLDSHIQRKDFILLSYFSFTTPERVPSFAGEALGIFNNVFFSRGSLVFCFFIGLVHLAVFLYFGWNALNLFVLDRRNS